MIFTAEEPTGLDMTENDSVLCASQRSAKSSKSRKLRQALQKKQLDVLLQTYSSYIDEPVDAGNTAATDYFSITRKKSIEGTPAPEKAETKPSNNSQRPQNGEGNRSRMRRSKSQVSDEGDYTSSQGYTSSPEDNHDKGPSDTDDESIDAVKGKHAKDRKVKKKGPANKRKKKVDFTARLSKAKEIVRAFSSRAAQKHLEIAADFHAVTKEISHQLKSGANVVCEDLADQFDSAVENLFVGDVFENRDDEGIRQTSSRHLARSEHDLPAQIRQDVPQVDDPDFEPLSHEETIELMQKQVSDILRPVAALTGTIQSDLGCFRGPDGFEDEEARRELTYEGETV